MGPLTITVENYWNGSDVVYKGSNARDAFNAIREAGIPVVVLTGNLSKPLWDRPTLYVESREGQVVEYLDRQDRARGEIPTVWDPTMWNDWINKAESDLIARAQCVAVSDPLFFLPVQARIQAFTTC